MEACGSRLQSPPLCARHTPSPLQDSVSLSEGGGRRTSPGACVRREPEPPPLCMQTLLQDTLDWVTHAKQPSVTAHGAQRRTRVPQARAASAPARPVCLDARGPTQRPRRPRSCWACPAPLFPRLLLLQPSDLSVTVTSSAQAALPSQARPRPLVTKSRSPQPPPTSRARARHGLWAPAAASAALAPPVWLQSARHPAEALRPQNLAHAGPPGPCGGLSRSLPFPARAPTPRATLPEAATRRPCFIVYHDLCSHPERHDTSVLKLDVHLRRGSRPRTEAP